jgi:hypothetical protein
VQLQLLRRVIWVLQADGEVRVAAYSSRHRNEEANCCSAVLHNRKGICGSAAVTCTFSLQLTFGNTELS